MLAGALLAFGIATYFGLKTYLHWELRTALRGDATAIGERFLETSPSDATLSTQVEDLLEPEINAKFVRVTSADGRVVYQSKAPLDGSFTPNTIPRLASIPPELFHADRNSGRAALYIVVLPYQIRDGRSYVVEVGADHNRIHETLHALLIIFTIGMSLVVVLASLGGRYMLRGALRPIRDITTKAEEVSVKSPQMRLPAVHSGDEIEQLSKALNRMLERLDRAFQEIHRFSADVSHELRTPLTILRGELESLITSGVAAAPDSIGSCLEEVERLGRVVDQLLILARLDAGDEVAREPVDVGTTVKQTAEQMRQLLDEKQLKLDEQIEANVVVRGNPWRLKQVAVNLLDNAIKYSRDGGTVSIRVQSVQRRAVLEIDDDGQGIPPDSLPHLFERFYRADRSRSRDTGGTGLGLSIVEAIVRAHCGSVSIRSKLGEGTSVHVELPLHRGHSGAGEPATASSPATSAV